MRTRKKINLVFVAAGMALLLFIGAVWFMNRSIQNKLEAQTKPVTDKTASQPIQPGPETRPVQQEQSDQLMPSDLAGYQIIPQRINRFTNNQRYWDEVTEKAVEQSGVLGDMENGGIFKGATMTPAEFQKQLQRINGRIEEYEQIVVREPGNDYAQKKLNDLYMLKSSISALEKNLIEKP